MSKEPKFVAKTLAWCNERRAEKGKKALKKLPKGIPMNGLSCPCGKATGCYVSYVAYSDEGVMGSIGKIPLAVSQFAQAFDAGQLPQYLAKP